MQSVNTQKPYPYTAVTVCILFGVLSLHLLMFCYFLVEIMNATQEADSSKQALVGSGPALYVVGQEFKRLKQISAVIFALDKILK